MTALLDLRRGCLAAILLLNWSSLATAADSAAADQPPVPVISTDPKVQQDLQSLDRFLDVNPKLQELLQSNLDQIDQPAFIEQHPEWHAELAKRPTLVRALKTERNFILHRTLVRRAHAPVVRKDLVQLDHFLEAHPDIRTAVSKRPALLVDTQFLVAHSALADFYQEHPSLSTILMERADARQNRKAQKKQ